MSALPVTSQVKRPRAVFEQEKSKEEEVKDLVARLGVLTDRRFAPFGKFLTKKTVTITSADQIDGLEEINSIPIKEVARSAGLTPAGFKELLKKDWETVEKAKRTHGELADALHAMGANAEGKKQVVYGGHTYEVGFMRYRGTSHDIFEKTPSWNVQCSISRGSDSVLWTPGAESSIRDYGFYGCVDEDSVERIDPEMLIRMLKM